MRNRAAILLTAGLACAFALAPLAAADAPKPSSCVIVNSIDDWRILDDSAIVVSTGPSKEYKVTFAGTCRHMKWSVLARIEARPSTALCLSSGDTIVFGRGGTPRHFEEEERCMIKSVERLETPPAQGPN